MSRNPILSPTHEDNDVLILEGVLAGVVAQGAKYGLSQARRALLAQTLESLIRSLREGWDEQFRTVLTEIQTGRPSHPASGRRGDSDLSDPTPKLPGRAGTD
jgi:hypothetical protein